MIRVVRLVVYEFDNEQLMEKQMGSSMPDGVKDFPHGTIKVATLSPSFVRALGYLGQAIDNKEATL